MFTEIKELTAVVRDNQPTVFSIISFLKKYIYQSLFWSSATTTATSLSGSNSSNINTINNSNTVNSSTVLWRTFHSNFILQ
jgi:hypothetical protein